MVNIKLILGIVVLTFFIFGCTETQKISDEYEQQPVEYDSTEEIYEDEIIEEIDEQQPIEEEHVEEIDEIVEETLEGITE